MMRCLMNARSRLNLSLRELVLGVVWVYFVMVVLGLLHEAFGQALPPVLPAPIYAPTIAPTTTLPPSITLPPVGR